MASSGSRNSPDRVRGSWSPEEDELLKRLVEKHGPRNWSAISNSIPGRSGKSCRLRWCNQLSPEVEKRPFTAEEDATIIRVHAQVGNKWATIARKLVGRTDNAVKNHWNSTLKRRFASSGGDFQFDLQANPPPLKRSASVGPSTNILGLGFNPGSPTLSDVSEPALPGSQGYNPVFVTGPVLWPGQEAFCQFPEPGSTLVPGQEAYGQFCETGPAQLPGHEPETALSLALPGSDLGEPSNHGSGSFGGSNQNLAEQIGQAPPPPPPLPPPPPSPPLPPPQPAPPAPAMVQETVMGSQNGGERVFGPFSRELLQVMQEMIRQEVKTYMDQHKNQNGGGGGSGSGGGGGMCYSPTEAITNAMMYRMGMSGVE